MVNKSKLFFLTFKIYYFSYIIKLILNEKNTKV